MVLIKEAITSEIYVIGVDSIPRLLDALLENHVGYFYKVLRIELLISNDQLFEHNR